MPRHLAHVLALVAACAAPDSGDGRDDDFLADGKADGAYAEGSPEATAVLAVANTLTNAQLDDDVGLDGRAATGIVDYRDGPTAATSDDDAFDTLAELDAVPYVGPIAFEKLLDYARANGLFQSDASWTWENPRPDASVRNALWSISANDIWAVGNEGLVEHWDGSTWSVVASGTTEHLNGVWASGPSDVWIGGDRGTVLHWTGSRFTALNIRSDFRIADLQGTSSSDIWFVGATNPEEFSNGLPNGRTVHWDGVGFDTVETCGGSQSSVLVHTATEITIGMERAWVCRFDGAQWRLERLEDAGSGWVTDLWRSPSGTTWAAYGGEIWRRDAAGWTMSFDPWTETEGSGYMTSIAGSAGSNVIWAAGWHGTVARFDGTTWTKSDVAGGAAYAAIAVTGTSAWAVGPAARARMTGGTWSETIEAVTRARLWEVSGSSPTNLWAWSPDAIVRRTGNGWSAVTQPVKYLSEVHAVAANDVWIFGEYGSAHWNGQGYAMHPDVHSVNGAWSSGNQVWGVGSLGTISHFDGTTWTFSKSPNGVELSNIHGSSPTDIWATGSSTVLHYDGTAWKVVELNEADRQYRWSSVLAIAPDDVWLTGRSYSPDVPNAMLRHLRHWNGTAWETVTPPTPLGATISVEWAAGSDDVWFVEHGRGVLHWNGTALQSTKILGADAVIGFGNALWVTGQHGMVRRIDR